MSDSCPHKDYCKNYDGCPDDSYHWLNCWRYNTIEGLIDRQVYVSKIRKRIFRSEHRHHQEEELP